MAAGSSLWQRTARLTVSKSAGGSLSTPFDQLNPGARTGVQPGSPAAVNAAANQLSVLDLSQMHFKFQIRGEDTESPSTMVIRIYNLKPDTEFTIIDECDQVNLQVGYVNGPTGIIFSGDIKQFKQGKENATDTFLEISAADGDHGYNFGFLNKTFAAGSGLDDLLVECAKKMDVTVDPNALAFVQASGVTFPRGQVLFNLVRVHMRDLAATLGARWSINDGVLYVIKDTSYLPGEVVVLGPRTGLVGFPEATDNGIQVQCLLNPLLKIGTAVQIDSDVVTQKVIIGQGFETYQAIDYVAKVSSWLYRIMSLDMSGDSRGNEWTSDLVCLAIDKTNPLAPVPVNP